MKLSYNDDSLLEKLLSGILLLKILFYLLTWVFGSHKVDHNILLTQNKQEYSSTRIYFFSSMTSLYETDKLLSEYLLFHYGDPSIVMPWEFGPREALHYPVRCVTLCFDLDKLSSGSRALDVGCAVGRSTFELARFCGEVIGMDYSHAFVRAAQELVSTGGLEYRYRVEGSLCEVARARIPAAVDRSRVSFEQGDAMALRENLGSFDAVLAANLICRLKYPTRFLERCKSLVNPGGQLVINTPFTWMEEYTPKEEWIGATSNCGESLQELIRVLQPHFTLDSTSDLPFLIREHRRKFQWSVAQSCRFVRNKS